MKCKLWMIQSWWGNLSAALVSIQIGLVIFRFFFPPWFISLVIFLAIFLEQNYDFSIPSGHCCSSDLLLKFSEFLFFPCLRFLLHINKVSQETSGHMWYFRFILHAPHRHCHETMIPVTQFELSLFDYQWTQLFFSALASCILRDKLLTFRWHLSHCGCVRLFCFFCFWNIAIICYWISLIINFWIHCGQV